MTEPVTVPCACDSPTARYDVFVEVGGGVDTTNGRHADVSIRRCRHCGQHWVRYHVEYEAFSKSGRWARGKIADDLAATIAVEDVAEYIDALPSYFAGGSLFDSCGFARTGRMPWEIVG
jgi:hypothetical protein